MPYNTRRKSLSLSSLGIHVPVTHAARAAAAAAAAAAASTTEPATASRAPIASAPSPSRAPPSNRSSHNQGVPGPTKSVASEQHQSKRIKRSHNYPLASRTPSPPSTFPGSIRKYEPTPPPSPGASSDASSLPDASDNDPHHRSLKHNLPTIQDDIVQGVVSQLLATGNRPHLVKELATVLSQRLDVVSHSANPCAIITSRLSAFMKRASWSESHPCPVAKDLEPVHPRRTYYFLTTRPRQPWPASRSSNDSQVLRVRVSPPIPGDTDSPGYMGHPFPRLRSPSPEIDLSASGLDDVGYEAPATLAALDICRRAPDFPRENRSGGGSPRLEKDEREFTQTATGLQRMRMGPHLFQPEALEPGQSLDDSLFNDGLPGPTFTVSSTTMHVSPAIRPIPAVGLARKDFEGDGWLKPCGSILDWDHMPENMELEELDCLLETC